ncbi:hypothetical protein BDZ88DRAFT_421518 [Geranomyces variabilis]|nr:hypothetical protein BDZ88DRAFT_421518 [Geranomyces variabilis]KAJ3140291.1 hypothetical protein HDU90_008519 [Geranomyces variabilis]
MKPEDLITQVQSPVAGSDTLSSSNNNNNPEHLITQSAAPQTTTTTTTTAATVSASGGNSKSSVEEEEEEQHDPFAGIIASVPTVHQSAPAAETSAGATKRASTMAMMTTTNPTGQETGGSVVGVVECSCGRRLVASGEEESSLSSSTGEPLLNNPFKPCNVAGHANYGATTTTTSAATTTTTAAGDGRRGATLTTSANGPSSSSTQAATSSLASPSASASPQQPAPAGAAVVSAQPHGIAPPTSSATTTTRTAGATTTHSTPSSSSSSATSSWKSMLASVFTCCLPSMSTSDKVDVEGAGHQVGGAGGGGPVMSDAAKLSADKAAAAAAAAGGAAGQQAGQQQGGGGGGAGSSNSAGRKGSLAVVKNKPGLLPPLEPADFGKKCLVLDLDETLVHSSFKEVPNADYVIPVEIEGVFHSVYVLKRPGVDTFLQRLAHQFEIVVFTASLPKYADPVLDHLDTCRTVKHRLFRDACLQHRGNYVKDLSVLGRNLNEVIILDNSPASYAFHPQNAIPVSTWMWDPNDTELLDLIPFLEDLKNCDDVTMVLDQTLDLGTLAATTATHVHSGGGGQQVGSVGNGNGIITQAVVQAAESLQK